MTERSLQRLLRRNAAAVMRRLASPEAKLYNEIDVFIRAVR